MKTILITHLLSIILLLPLSGALAILLVPRRQFAWARWLGLGAALSALLIGWHLHTEFRGTAGFEYAEFVPWISELGMMYWIGVDGLSIDLLGLTLLLSPLVLFLCGSREDDRASWILVLFIESALLGCFVALDLMLCIVFLVGVVVAVYFLIHLRCASGANSFLGFQILGLMALVLCAVILMRQGRGHSDLASLIEVPLSPQAQIRWGGVFLGGLLILSALFPVQLWLKHVMRTNSLALFVLLTGLFLKVGPYLVMRFAYPLFPHAIARYADVLVGLGMINIVGSGLLVMASRSMGERLTYLTMGHMGLIWVGIASQQVDGAQGALFFMIAQGLLAVWMGLTLFANRSSALNLSLGEGDGNGLLSRITMILIAAVLLGIPGTSFATGLWLVLVPEWFEFPSLTVAALIGWMLAAGTVAYALQGLKHSASLLRQNFVCWALIAAVFTLLGMHGLQAGPALERSRTAVTQWLDKGGVRATRISP